ncbi:response regulator transcription factor [Sphingomonas sp. BK235]|uniref:response regulator transcription factor n=1 Tax=Sphingomonas sp. BK235 TaxID=2512131 RepID=UPI001053A9E8|nr:response regulator transcription factor [Sphingomonas sp. BK235]TCP34231.1 winged helix family two component transcriptional regulator [Sphingomonas sp. BK235]
MRLLIVEDHDELVGMLRRLLAAAGFASDHAGTAEDALLMLEVGSYAAVVLDVGLPDGDGRDVARRLRARGDATPVILLTARGSVDDRVAGLAAGGDDYLVKPFAPEELVARVQALLRRSGLIADRAIACGNTSFDPATREVRVGGVPAVLHARELALFELLIQRRERVVAKAQIEAQLFGMEELLGSNAVEVGVHRLRRRLAEAGATAQIVTVRGVGYMLAEAGA